MSSTVPYDIKLIDDGKIILATWNSNAANFFNYKSLDDWNNMLDEIESPSNKHLYYNKPIIFTSPQDSKCFSAGIDLKAVANTENIEGTRQLLRKFTDTVALVATLQHRTIVK